MDLGDSSSSINIPNDSSSTTIPKKKHAGGRPTSYRKEYCKEIVDYFSDSSNFYPTFEDYAARIRSTITETIVNWSKSNPEFFAAYMRAKEMQKNRLFRGALKEEYNPGFAKFLAINTMGMISENAIQNVATTYPQGIQVTFFDHT